ncbi:hypothetical protein EV363DRAFT_1297752 [Boletus edulis]|nr:hypothetical protein EV363DRAFT_1297752 [Boletus edulis]
MEHLRENCLYKSFKELLRWIPSIREVSQADLTQVIHLDKEQIVEVANWLMCSSPKPTPSLVKDNKSGRGFYNNSTGRLLCPVNYDWNNATHWQNIHDLHPNFLVSAQSWPTFLYADYQFNYQKPSEGMKTIQPRAIAYVACQFYDMIVDWFEGANQEKDQKFIDNLLLW